MPQLDQFFRSVKLPTVSEVAQRLVHTLNDDDAGAAEVGAIIAQDPALAAKLLRLANSAQMGLPRKVGTVQESVQLLGMGRVRMLALGASMTEAFPALPGLDAQSYWRASMACAGYAQWLATPAGLDAAHAWLTGMMLRLGELLIGQTQADAIARIEAQPRLPGARWDRERELVGYAEGQITAELARRWSFPTDMCKALEHAHAPLDTTATWSPLAGVLHIAGTLADEPNPNVAAVEVLDAEVVRLLGLDVAWLKAKLPDPATFVSVH